MPYDELFHDDCIRPVYREYIVKHSQMTLLQRKRAMRAARACVRGDADFLPMVRLMRNQEYNRLLAGVRQRGRALQMFLNDYYFGGRSYESAGILTRLQVARIRQRYELNGSLPALRPENIQFCYGPDIMRDNDGNFRVIEDNLGFVGGMGDLEAFADAAEALGVPLAKSRHPRTFYRRMVKLYNRQARDCGGGKTVLLSYPRAQRWNYEDERLERVLSNLNVTIISDFRKLKVVNDGLYHREERVGFVILNVNYEDIDPVKTSANRIRGFWQAVSKRQVGVSYVPGLEFVGAKTFCPNVEKLVEYYLGEKCLLPSLPILDLSNSRAIKTVRREREQWVIKLCKAQSGESVWVGKHLTPTAWAKLLNRVEKRGSEYIAQRYCEPSQIMGHAVDLRPLAIISPQNELLSPIPWGRAASSGSSKTNISCGGLLAPVAIVAGR